MPNFVPPLHQNRNVRGLKSRSLWRVSELWLYQHPPADVTRERPDRLLAHAWILGEPRDERVSEIVPPIIDLSGVPHPLPRLLPLTNRLSEPYVPNQRSAVGRIWPARGAAPGTCAAPAIVSPQVRRPLCLPRAVWEIASLETQTLTCKRIAMRLQSNRRPRRNCLSPCFRQGE